MRYRALLFVLLFTAAAPLAAQEVGGTIDPGMSHDDVVKRLGKPLNERSSGTHTYMFYKNGCERTCGINDLVVLEDGKVVDAVFRNGVRNYSGTSTSPTSLAPNREANSATRRAAATVTGLRVESITSADSATVLNSNRPAPAPAAPGDSIRKP